jgi:hypothetical protein
MKRIVVLLVLASNLVQSAALDKKDEDRLDRKQQQQKDNAEEKKEKKQQEVKKDSRQEALAIADIHSLIAQYKTEDMRHLLPNSILRTPILKITGYGASKISARGDVVLLCLTNGIFIFGRKPPEIWSEAYRILFKQTPKACMNCLSENGRCALFYTADTRKLFILGCDKVEEWKTKYVQVLDKDATMCGMNADGNAMVLGFSQGNVRILESNAAGTYAPVYTHDFGNKIIAIGINADGTRALALTSSYELYVIDRVRAGVWELTFKCPNKVTHVAMSADGASLMLRLLDDSICLLQQNAKGEWPIIFKMHLGYSSSRIALSARSSIMAATYTTKDNNMLYIADFERNQEGRFPLPEGAITALGVSSNGSCITVVCNKKLVVYKKIFKSWIGNVISSDEVHGFPELSADGTYLLFNSKDKEGSFTHLYKISDLFDNFGPYTLEQVTLLNDLGKVVVDAAQAKQRMGVIVLDVEQTKIFKTLSPILKTELLKRYRITPHDSKAAQMYEKRKQAEQAAQQSIDALFAQANKDNKAAKIRLIQILLNAPKPDKNDLATQRELIALQQKEGTAVAYKKLTSLITLSDRAKAAMGYAEDAYLNGKEQPYGQGWHKIKKF